MSAPVYQFAGFRLDCTNFELRRNGTALRVERMPMELLILLVSRQGELVTREEIGRHLWSSEVFVDTEHGINTAIRKIRYVLRDDPDTPRILLTVKGKGYRIICPVESADGRAELQATSRETGPIRPADPSPQPGVAAKPAMVPQLPAETVAEPKRRRSWLIAAATLSVVVVLAAIAYRYTPGPTLRVTQFKQITHDGRTKAIIGTDGSRLYFNWSPSSQHFGEVAVSGGQASPLQVHIPAATSIEDLAADGSSLLIKADDQGRQSLWSVRVPEGSVRHIADVPEWSAAWSPDGKSLLYSTADDEIFLSNSDGSGAHNLFQAEDRKTKLNTESITWSPDGSRVLFSRGDDIWEMFAGGEGLHEVFAGWQPGNIKCCGRWTPDGQTFLFLVKDETSNPLLPGNQLWAVSGRNGTFSKASNKPIQLAPGPIRWDTPIPGRDGKTIFARGVILRGELVRYDAKSNQLQPWLEGSSVECLTFSPSGDSIAYVTFPEGVLWKANRDGSNPVQLTTPQSLYPLGPHFSPDGTRILFFTFTLLHAKAYVVPTNGGPPQLLVPEDNQDQVDPSWAPDGNRVIYGWPKWERGNTANILHILDLHTRQVVTLPGSQGKWSPRWSPNGRYIACLNATGGISVFDFRTQRWWEVQKGERDYPTWSSDSRFLYFLLNLDASPGVYRVPVTGGTSERIVDLQGFRHTGAAGLWMGLDPTDTPLLLRDTGSDDIYALTLERR